MSWCSEVQRTNALDRNRSQDPKEDFYSVPDFIIYKIRTAILSLNLYTGHSEPYQDAAT